jgi:hypothetical protein
MTAVPLTPQAGNAGPSPLEGGGMTALPLTPQAGNAGPSPLEGGGMTRTRIHRPTRSFHSSGGSARW